MASKTDTFIYYYVFTKYELKQRSSGGRQKMNNNKNDNKATWSCDDLLAYARASYDSWTNDMDRSFHKGRYSA